MRQFKTSKRNRTNYVYYLANGEIIVITPDQASENTIELLHEFDDKEYDLSRRERDHSQVNIDALRDAGYDPDTLPFMADDRTPDVLLEKRMDEDEFRFLFEQIYDLLRREKPGWLEIIKAAASGCRTNVAIAKELNTNESSVRRRINTMKKKLPAFLLKNGIDGDLFISILLKLI